MNHREGMINYTLCDTKHILNMHKHIDGGFFWDKYSAFPYMGCRWGCKYCYCREEKYDPHINTAMDSEVQRFQDPFSQCIKIKKNSPELLKKALQTKPVDLLYLSGYQPIEAKYKYLRNMLRVCLELDFPVFINEKSPLLLEDLDILMALHKKSYVNVGWSIVFADDDGIKRVFEPIAPSIRHRFNAMRKLANHNIMTGIILMPILPFVNDTEKYIEEIIIKTKKHGGQYVLDGGLTLEGYTKKYFYNTLKKYDSKLIDKYIKLFDDQRKMESHRIDTHKCVRKYCHKYGLLNYIPRPVSYYPQKIRLNKKIAGIFYVKARENQLSKGPKYREWAYRKAAWSLDELTDSVCDIYKQYGFEGIMEINNIGQEIGEQIIRFCK